MTVLRVRVSAFLNLKLAGAIVDVRSPSEFAHAHIPGAVNIPLFDDALRAEIGTLYTQRGAAAAINRGFEALDGRLDTLRKQLLANASHGALRVHCWRGGMRSESVAWLAERSGLEVYLLDGGYKAFRNYVLSCFAVPRKLQILAGLTGVGKTEVLNELSNLGEQVIDLEALAHHKGSAFGWLGEKPQPTTEQFENELALKLTSCVSSQRLWLEDESKNIGKVLIPNALFMQMHNAPRLILQTSVAERIERLERMYAQSSAEDLIRCVEKIRRRLGGDRANRCIEQIGGGELRTAICTVLDYYDKQYHYSIDDKNMRLQVLNTENKSASEVALDILAILKE